MVNMPHEIQRPMNYVREQTGNLFIPLRIGTIVIGISDGRPEAGPPRG
jgi:hypothetical protein